MEKPVNQNSHIDDSEWYKEFSSIPNLLVYVKDHLLHFLTEDPTNIYSVMYYASAALILLGLWYFFFWRPFDWYRVRWPIFKSIVQSYLFHPKIQGKYFICMPTFLKDFTELGFDDVKNHYPQKSQTARKNAINELRRRRKIGDLPPVYPNGWFVILETEQLPVRTSKEISVLGKQSSISTKH